MKCTTVLQGSVCHRTSTPHKSGNMIKGTKMEHDTGEYPGMIMWCTVIKIIADPSIGKALGGGGGPPEGQSVSNMEEINSVILEILGTILHK